MWIKNKFWQNRSHENWLHQTLILHHWNPTNVKMDQESSKILGINLTAELPAVVQANIYPALEKIQNIIKIWSMRKLTLFGKITVIKSLLESQLVYKLSVLPNPSHQLLKEIDQALFNFLWDNKPHRITKHMAIEPRDLGGLSMIDIYTKIWLWKQLGWNDSCLMIITPAILS